jgi:hypothetical protein
MDRGYRLHPHRPESGYRSRDVARHAKLIL